MNEQPAVGLYTRLSAEQKDVVDSSADNNVIVDSVAGCGKTTTSLALCQKYATNYHLLLTFNRHLKSETVDRAKRENINNVEIHTYHSMCHMYFNPSPTSDGIIDALDESMQPNQPIPPYNTIIIDEAQDMENLYYRFVTYMIHFIPGYKNLKFVVLGDTNQAIYAFKGSDSRFLTEAAGLFPSPYPWVNKSITTSYRITKPIASLVNEHILCTNRLQSVKDGPLVDYHFHPVVSRHPEIRREAILAILKSVTAAFKPEEIFVLASSIKPAGKRPGNYDNKKTVQVIENLLVKELNYPCYAPSSDDSEIRDVYTMGKVVISTYHQSKGRERKCVLLVDFDNFSYEQNLNRVTPDEKELLKELTIRTTNVCYVAATRALERLIILQNCEKKVMCTTSPTKILGSKHYINVVGFVAPKEKQKVLPQTIRPVTSFLRFMPLDIGKQLLRCLLITKTSIPTINIDTGVKSENPSMAEDMSDIYGNVITMLSDLTHTKTLPNVYYDLLSIPECREEYPEYRLELKNMGIVETVENFVSIWEHDGVTIPDVRAVTKTETFRSLLSSGFHSRWRQMKNRYGYIPADKLMLAAERINEIITADKPGLPTFARLYEHEVCNYSTAAKVKLDGRVDIGTELKKEHGHIYEIKFTTMTTNEHMVQLACYGYITGWKHAMTLLNIRAGERYDISLLPGCEDAFEKLLQLQQNERVDIISDHDFNKSMKSEYEKIVMKINNLADDTPLVTVAAPTAPAINNRDLLEKINRTRLATAPII